MTAEITVMNKQAIAIAAESAVTVHAEDGEKIFVSANKIFALSKYQPVGIMIYGNASFMGIPWETVIKNYRRELNEQQFNKLEEYAIDFISYLKKQVHLIPDSVQLEHVTYSIYSYFYFLNKKIKKEIEAVIAKKKGITPKELKEITKRIITRAHTVWSAAPLLADISVDQIQILREKNAEIIKKAQKEIFENLPINTAVSDKLSEIAANLFVKFPENEFPPNFSAVVIAGFGKENVFPSLREYLIDGLVSNILKFKEGRKNEISHSNESGIIPFAQSEMVYRFMEGVDISYENIIEKFLLHIAKNYLKLSLTV